MIDQPRLNFHIGFSKMASDFVRHAEKNGFVPLPKSTRIISQDSYRSVLRHLVNDKLSVNYTDGLVYSKLSKYRGNQNQVSLLVGSQHSLLGTPAQLLSPDKVLPLAEKRLKNLSEIFTNQNIVFHMTIKSQLSFAKSLALNSEFKPKLERFLSTHFSWIDLISRLSKACPERQFIVWDFEDEANISLAFLSSLLSLEDEQFNETTREIISDDIRTTTALEKIFSPVNELPEAEMGRFNVIYEQDLEGISRLPNVILYSLQ